MLCWLLSRLRSELGRTRLCRGQHKCVATGSVEWLDFQVHTMRVLPTGASAWLPGELYLTDYKGHTKQVGHWCLGIGVTGFLTR